MLVQYLQALPFTEILNECVHKSFNIFSNQISKPSFHIQVKLCIVILKANREFNPCISFCRKEFWQSLLHLNKTSSQIFLREVFRSFMEQLYLEVYFTRQWLI